MPCAEQREREAQIVRGYEDEGWCRHARGQPRRSVHEARAADQPARGGMRDPAGRRRDRFDAVQTRDYEPANLDEPHQRHPQQD